MIANTALRMSGQSLRLFAPARPPLAFHSSRGVTARLAALIRLLASVGEMSPVAAAASSSRTA